MSTTSIIALVLSGYLLIGAEVFIPGGIAGFLGTVMVVVGILCGFIFMGPAEGLVLLVTSGVLGLIGFWMWVTLLPKTPWGRRLLLDQDGRDWKSCDTETLGLEGKEGVAHTTLRPSGTALIDGQRVDVVTRGEMIEARTRVRVIRVEGNRVVVTAQS